MYHLTLEIGNAGDAERFDDDPNLLHWEPIASSQADSELQAKALMLENVLEALNNGDLMPNNEWLRLVHQEQDDNNKFNVVKVEVF